jgi:tetratricopeptide (TPR) repeat protein
MQARAQAAARVAQGATAGTAPIRTACVVDTLDPIAAEEALNKKDYKNAETLFRGLLSKSAEDSAAHEGLVRSLIAQDKVNDAGKETETWLASSPGDSMALTAAGDALLRQGDPREASRQFHKAAQADGCNARAYFGIAEVDELAGMHASAKRMIDQAYKLHPTDNDINTFWIYTLPRIEQLAKWTEYSERSKQISDDDRAKLKTRLSKESLYRASDCRMAATSPREAKVPMQAINGGAGDPQRWGLDVEFSGKRRRLQIDTGASGITISRAAAMFLGIQREDATQTGGIGDKGLVRTSVTHVASVKIGGIEFTNCPVEILEKWNVLDSDGLIGGDVFEESLLTLDFPNHELRIAPLPPRPGKTEADREKRDAAGDDAVFEPHDPYIAPEMAKWMRVYRSGHEILMPTDIVETKRKNDESAWRNKLFLLDTGSDSNMITPAAAKEVSKVSRDYENGIRGVSGEVDKVYDAGKFTVAFAGLRLDSYSMTAADLTSSISHGAGTEVSGIIGAQALYQFELNVDYRDNLVLLVYTSKW